LSSSSTADDLGKLILRLILGVLILFHGAFKLRHGISGIEGMIAGHGLPAFFGWAVFLGEVLGPILLILGFYARVGGLLVALDMLVAFTLVHGPQLFHLTGSGGWQPELQGMYLCTGLAIALLGAGRFSLGGRNGRFN
jgi:putative oxidoreductase